MSHRREATFSESVSINAEFNPTTVRTLERSLSVEAADLADERSTTRIGRDGDELRIDIDAADRTALRAASNTWLGLLSVAEETADLVDNRV